MGSYEDQQWYYYIVYLDISQIKQVLSDWEIWDCIPRFPWYPVQQETLEYGISRNIGVFFLS